MRFGDAKVTPCISLESAAHRSDISEFEAEAAAILVQSHPRGEIASELGLVQPPRWMAGLWGDENGGWHDSRTDTFLSFDDARQLVEARIKELGLSPKLVHEFPHSCSGSIAAHQRFWRMDFSDRMEMFRERD